MFVLRSAAIVLMLVTIVAGTVAAGGGLQPPGGGMPPPGGGGMPPPPPPPPPPLVITEFIAVSTFGTVYSFDGKVTGGDGSAITINFGDAPTMKGKSCKVQEDGSFTFTIELTLADYGPVSGQAVNASGQMSALDFVFVLVE